MSLQALSVNSLQLVRQMIPGCYALFQPPTSDGSSEHWRLAFFPYESSVQAIQHPVDSEPFRELWRHGFLYRAGKTAFAHGPAIYFLLTGTARLLWSAYRVPERKRKPSSDLLEILDIMARGLALQVYETNGPHTTWKCQLPGKTLLRSAVAQTFVKQGWVKPIGLPTNPDGNSRCWQWTYELSEEGRQCVIEKRRAKSLVMQSAQRPISSPTGRGG